MAAPNTQYICIVSNDKKLLVALVNWLSKQTVPEEFETCIKHAETKEGLLTLLEDALTTANTPEETNV